METMTRGQYLRIIAEKLLVSPDEFTIKSPVILVHWSTGIALERSNRYGFSYLGYDDQYQSSSTITIDGTEYKEVGKELWDAWNYCYNTLEEKAKLKALNKTVRRLYNIKWWQK